MGVVYSVEAQLCGTSGRHDDIHLPTRRYSGPTTMQDWIDEGVKSPGKRSSFPPPAPPRKLSPLESALSQCPDGAGNAKPAQILEAIFGLESVCRGNIDAWLNGVQDENSARVEVMVDETGSRYCLCHDPNTAIVIGLLWIELADITVELAAEALGDQKERLLWDGASQFTILQDRYTDDPLSSEITLHMLKAPWPFKDRAVLQRRNRLPLQLNDPNLGEGVAFVTQSIDDPGLYPEDEDHVRAIVHMAGHLLRPLPAENAQLKKAGIEITVCQKIDIGGVAPAWAQSMLCRLASRQGQHWAERLRQHCLTMQRREAGAGDETVDAFVDLPESGYELWDRELMGQ